MTAASKSSQLNQPATNIKTALPMQTGAIGAATPTGNNPQTCSTNLASNTPSTEGLTMGERTWKQSGIAFYGSIARKLAHNPNYRSVVRDAQAKIAQYLDELGDGDGEDF